MQKLKRNSNLGINLRRLRNDHGFSQEGLCSELQRRSCDVGRSTYQKYEEGRLNVPVNVLTELKMLYKCTFDEFFMDTNLK